MHELWLRLRALRRSHQLDRDLEDEMAFHLEMRESSLREDGVAAAEAGDRARRQFGNTLKLTESLREQWRWGALDRALGDLRFGLRLAGRQRVFTAIVVATLAIGVGASTAMFTIVDAVLLRPFTLPDPDGVVVVWETNRERDINRFTGSVANYVDWRSRTASFADLGAFEIRSDNRTDGPRAEQFNGAVASASLFRALGIQPAYGRFFRDDEDRPGHARVAVLGFEYWRRHFGGDPAAVGRSVVVNGQPHDIIGIMPPMRAPLVADMWRPLAPDVADLDRGDHHVIVVGRIAPGRTVDQAEAELQTIAARLAAEYPKTNAGWSVRIESLYDAVVEPPTQRSMMVLMSAVGLLLLIACVNVANLMLARGTQRQREVATRMALGASRGRVAAQLLVEAGVLSALGAAAGLIVAAWSLRLAEWLFPNELGIGHLDPTGGSALSLNRYALVFAGVIAVVTTFVVGVAPALRMSRTRLVGGMMTASRTTTEGARAGRLRNSLVVAEIALALVLLAGAGLLMRSVDRLRQEPVGFNAEGVITGKVGLYGDRYQTLQGYSAFIDGLVTDLEGRPGIAAAGVTSSVPFGGGYTSMQATPDGAPPDLEAGVQAQWRVIGGNYLPAMGIALKAGRTFNGTDDRRRATRSTIINETLAERLWPGENPIGKILLASDSRRPYEVVGLTPSSRLTLLGRTPEPAMYFHYLQFPWATMTVAVRAAGSTTGVERVLRAAVAGMDRDQPVSDIRPLSELVVDAAAAPQMNASLVALFATLALTLAAIGVYGLMSYSAAQRTGEIGIRLALGARPIAMFSLIWTQGLRLAGMGLGLGLVGAVMAAQGLSVLLYQVSPLDPLTFGIVIGMMLAVTFAACVIPARRAMRTDASVVLRHE